MRLNGVSTLKQRIARFYAILVLTLLGKAPLEVLARLPNPPSSVQAVIEHLRSTPTLPAPILRTPWRANRERGGGFCG